MEVVNADGTTEQKAKPARIGSKNTSSRLRISDTIERNPENLNSINIENDATVDPMFHLMSKAFDEGGAKGMLMANLVSSYLSR